MNKPMLQRKQSFLATLLSVALVAIISMVGTTDLAAQYSKPADGKTFTKSTSTELSPTAYAFTAKNLASDEAKSLLNQTGGTATAQANRQVMAAYYLDFSSRVTDGATVESAIQQSTRDVREVLAENGNTDLTKASLQQSLETLISL